MYIEKVSNIARRMLLNGKTDDEILKVTRLSVVELNKLKEAISKERTASNKQTSEDDIEKQERIYKRLISNCQEKHGL